MATPVTTAPKPGTNPAFDDLEQKSWDAVTAGGNPDKLTRDQVRETLAQRLAAFEVIPMDGRITEPLIVGTDEMPEEQTPRHRTLIIPKAGTNPLWWDDPKDAEFLDWAILTRHALGSEFHGGVLITGPAGIGKTTSVQKAVERVNAAHGMNLALMKMDCATVTDPQKWFGRREVDKGGTRYEKSDLIVSIERGDVILLDDITRLHPSIHNGIMPFLDNSNAVTLSDLNVTVNRHPKTVFLATANIGVQFGGTHRMDWAMRERFPYTLEREWPPRDVEIDILVSHTNCDRDGATMLVDIAAKTRKKYESGDIRTPVSTRTLVATARLVASGMTEREALELTAVPLYDTDANGIAGDESERQIVRGLITGKLGHA